MASPIQLSSALSPVQTPVLPKRTDNPQVKAATLPIIAALGNQTKIAGDNAGPACVACWTACLAGPLVAICSGLCGAMSISPLAATE